MQNWKDLYLELSEKISTIEAVKWIDLWHNQVNFLEEEHPFPSPAVFLSFRILSADNAGRRAQTVRLQVDAYVFYETFSDTYKGSWNQESALEFLEIINSVYALLQATSGVNYSSMRRIGMSPVDTGSAGNLYLLSFECHLLDEGAMPVYEDAELPEKVEVERYAPEPPSEDPEEPPMFIIPRT